MSRPNILILMCDQMQAAVLEPDHPAQTPHLDALCARGTRFPRGYTPNAICSPARASLMTGLLPHRHGVLTVTHTVDRDQSCLRTEHAHFAQQLQATGYRTGYFGKWHVERSGHLADFGWQEQCTMEDEGFRAARQASPGGERILERFHTEPPGYPPSLHYAVTTEPPEHRPMGVITAQAGQWLEQVLAGSEPWCGMVSLPEPHDAYICGAEAYQRYDVDALPLPANADDDLRDKPNIYRRSARTYQDLSQRQHREALACYYASISEIDACFGRLIDRIDAAGQLQDTIILLCADHGDLMGAHGLWTKNFGAFEEVYRIPLVAAGPGISAGAVSQGRIGLHDLGPTLCALVGADPLPASDGSDRSHLLRDPTALQAADRSGFAEYFGGRYMLTQRIYWQDDLKYVFNGFDFDELYDLAEDPGELHNRIDDPDRRPQAEDLMRQVWRRIDESGDHSLAHSAYPPLRLGIVGMHD